MADDEQQIDYSVFDGMSAIELVRALDDVQKQKEEADAKAKTLGRIFDHLRITRIPAAFDDEGITMLSVEGVGRCSLTADMHASIAAGQQDQAFEWLRDTGRADVIRETVNSGTLKAVLKKALLDGEALPQDVFNVSPFTRASITRRGV
jgi:hypothetical protein